MKIIERSWQSYRAHIMPKHADSVQIKETRLAFYSGATVLFSILTGDQFFDEGEIETADDLERMQMIQDEVDAFGAELDLAVLEIRKH